MKNEKKEKFFIKNRKLGLKKCKNCNKNCFENETKCLLIHFCNKRRNPTLSKRIYARMMCSFLNRDRVAAFVDLVHSTEDRLIVFYNYNDELETMLDALTTYTGDLERPCSIINGEKDDRTAYEQYENSITFIQYQAGSMGVNLQKANKIIYFSLTDRSELFEQSKKRIHRIGQEKPCFYYIMLCPGTVEEDILHALEMRKDYTDELFKAYQAKHNR